MTGEEIYTLLCKMAARGDSPRKRERQLRKLAEREGLSSDALRAKARRYARKAGVGYPLMRKPATENREQDRTARRARREQLRAERIIAGEAAIAAGADWAQLAALFGIKTAEGAAQWWRRNHDGVRTSRKRTRRRRRTAKSARAAA